MYTSEEVAEAIFQDSGSEFGGDASDSDFEVSQTDNSSSNDNNSDFAASEFAVSALGSGSSDPDSRPSRGHCVVFIGKTLHSESASLHPGV